VADEVRKALCAGELKIGGVTLPCAVLEDETRVLTMGEFLQAIGRARTPKGRTKAVDELPPFLEAANLQPYIDADLRASTTRIVFKRKSGGLAYGYRAELLPAVCRAFLQAREDRKLRHTQQHIAQQCEVLMRGFAHVGIIALVDEATGYQRVRARRSLEQILEKFITKELQPWAKRFPDEFYEELFRLRGWSYEPWSIKRPAYVGKLTNDLVYARLAPAVLEELRKKNPPDEKGRRRHKHHQWLTQDVGHPKLHEHLISVIALEKASATWSSFYRGIQRAFPQYNQTIPLDLLDKDELEDEKRTGG
jgi:hypothetical protein